MDKFIVNAQLLNSGCVTYSLNEEYDTFEQASAKFNELAENKRLIRASLQQSHIVEDKAVLVYEFQSISRAQILITKNLKQNES